VLQALPSHHHHHHLAAVLTPCRPGRRPLRSLQPAQHRSGKLNAQQTTNMLCAASQDPNTKRQSVVDAADALSKGAGRGGPADVLRGFQIQMGRELVEVQVGWGGGGSAAAACGG
jgi:hypothetical protein